LAPKIGFTLFPLTDEGAIDITIETKEGTDEKTLEKYLTIIDNSVSDIEELKVYSSIISGNKIETHIELIDNKYRQDNNLRTVFEIEKLI
jgi:multidrug efflux pump subunit AcrB